MKVTITFSKKDLKGFGNDASKALKEVTPMLVNSMILPFLVAEGYIECGCEDCKPITKATLNLLSNEQNIAA